MLFGMFSENVWKPTISRLRECTRVGYESAYRTHIRDRWSNVDMDATQ